MPLTDIKIKQAKPKGKPYKLADERGLYIEVAPSGGKWWRFKYRYEGKEKRISLGTYPDILLAVARVRRDEARKLVAQGVDPSENRKAVKLAKVDAANNCFEVVAREWHKKQLATWSPSHADKVIRRLERDVFPWIGAKPFSDIKAPELLKVLRRIENRAVETAHRALQNCGQVFRYAVATGRAEHNVAADLLGSLQPWKPIHYPSITNPENIAPLLRDLWGYQGTFVVQFALRLAPLVFLRPSELRLAQWHEFSIKELLWTIPPERTKNKRELIIPLSNQALAIVEELRPLTGSGKYVFEGRTTNKPISDNTLNAALRRLGYSTKEEFTGHGFRAMARTVLDEVLGYPVDWIEHQLGHAVRDPNGRAYNRTAHLPGRKQMMQSWADYLDHLRTEGNEGSAAGYKHI